MKKSRLFLATGVFALAFGAAFATKAHQNTVALGYAQLPDNCQMVTNVPEDCGTSFTNICTSGGIVYYQGRDTVDPSVCVEFLTRP